MTYFLRNGFSVAKTFDEQIQLLIPDKSILCLIKCRRCVQNPITTNLHNLFTLVRLIAFVYVVMDFSLVNAFSGTLTASL